VRPKFARSTSRARSRARAKPRRPPSLILSPYTRPLFPFFFFFVSSPTQGYCVLAGSCVRSLPQIIKIVRARSVTGLSLAANAAELVAYSITFAYNFRLGYGFSTYGELVSCWAQDIVLVGLLLHYGPGLRKRAAAGAAAYGALLWAFMSGAVPMPVLTALQASTIFIVALGGRVPQILLNAKRGDSGQLSILTSALNLAGNVARVFTTVVLTGDGLNLAGALVQGVLNSILLSQCWATLVRRRRAEVEGEGKGEGVVGGEVGAEGGGSGEGDEPATLPPLPPPPPARPPPPEPAIVPGLAGA
jgi:mannose-P-dolichol utilization defect 1